MKYLFLIIYLILSAWSAHSQTAVKQGALHPLEVGDKVPDIVLGTLMNDQAKKIRFSDLKGELLILDFWGIYCTACITSFSHMEKLQAEFSKSVQILLVNPMETQQQIENRFAFFRQHGSGYILPDLPCVVDAKQLKELFPYHSVPYHVWIDKNGIVRAMGSPLNANAEDIANFLAGKHVDFFKNGNTYAEEHKPLKFFTDSGVVSKQMGSFISRFNINYDPTTTMIEGKDTLAATYRRTFINTEGMILYYNVFRKKMDAQRKEMILGPSSQMEDNTEFIKLFVTDSLRYTAPRPFTSAFTSKGLIKSKYCYEQLTPLNMDDAMRRNYMLDDLNRYFGNLYGAIGSLEELKTPCYVLVRTSGLDKVSSLKTNGGADTIIRDRKKMIVWYNSSLKFAIRSGIQNSAFASSFTRQNTADGRAVFFLDETGFSTSGNIEIALPEPSAINNLEDLRKALLPYDLDIIQADRVIQYVTIREKGFDKSNQSLILSGATK